MAVRIASSLTSCEISVSRLTSILAASVLSIHAVLLLWAAWHDSPTKHAFTLTRPTQDRDFIVNSLLPSNQYQSADIRIDLLMMRFLEAPFAIDGHKLSTIAKEPGFSILEERKIRTEIAGKATDAVELVVNYVPKADESQLLGMRVVLWPENHYSIIDYSGPTSWGGLSGTIEYGPLQNGIHLSRVVTQQYWKEKPLESQAGDAFSFHFTEFQPYDADENEFTLDAFGIKNISPTWISRRLLLLLNLLAILLLIVFIIFRRARSVSTSNFPDGPIKTPGVNSS